MEQALAQNGIVRSAYPSKLAHALAHTAPEVLAGSPVPEDGAARSWSAACANCSKPSWRSIRRSATADPTLCTACA
ncbi:hypothetical protein [Kitasatospora sp. MAP5-34]|uniref:hypothetical protein n=1 Tax=Kitasatospora sp. MAP5-34 TaxID=3035102 RepID=UPI0024751248|nr:hypothetical protein [Kitasatospora sp. MAP5-34]